VAGRCHAFRLYEQKKTVDDPVKFYGLYFGSAGFFGGEISSPVKVTSLNTVTVETVRL